MKVYLMKILGWKLLSYTFVKTKDITRNDKCNNVNGSECKGMLKMLQCVTISIKSFRFCLYTRHNAKRIQSPITKHMVYFMKKTLSIAQWSHVTSSSVEVTGEDFNTSSTPTTHSGTVLGVVVPAPAAASTTHPGSASSYHNQPLTTLS